MAASSRFKNFWIINSNRIKNNTHYRCILKQFRENVSDPEYANKQSEEWKEKVSEACHVIAMMKLD